MKKYYYIVLFLFSFSMGSIAQDLIIETQAGWTPSVTEANRQSTTKIQKPFRFSHTDIQDKGIVFLDLKQEVRRALLEAKSDYIELTIPVDEEHELLLELSKKEILAPGFVVRTSNGKVDDSFAKRTVFYQGKVRGLDEGWVTLSVFDGELTVFINSNKGRLMLGKMTNEDTYVFYNEARVVPEEPFSCYTSDDNPPSTTTPKLEHSNLNLKSSNCPVPVYIEVDFESYQSYSGTQQQRVNEITNYMTGLFNQIVAVYNAISIPIVLSELKVWTMADPYPKYTGSGGSGNVFQVLEALGENVKDNYNGRLAHLISIRQGDNNLASGGGAHTGVLCTTYGPSPFTDHYGPYAVSGVNPTYNNYPTYDGALGTVAHELGHNFGSQHTHQCLWGVNGNQAIDNCATVNGTNCSNVVIHDTNQDPNYESTQGTIMSYCDGGVQAFYSGNGAFDGPQEVIQNGYMTALNTCFAETFYVDADGDGFGSNTTLDCGVFNGSSNNLDSNDNNPNINPNTIEDCDNDVDDNGNGETDENTLALKFDGSNDEVSFGNTLGNFGTGDFTIEMRIKTTQTDDFILSKRLTCDGVNSFWQIFIIADGNVSFSAYEGGGVGSSGNTNGTNVADGSWHHIAVTRKNGAVSMYIDGVHKFTTTLSFNLNNSADLTLGTSVCGVNTYAGQIDELRIWNKALSSASVDEFKEAALPANLPGLVAYYDFNNPDAVPAGDNTNPAQTTVEDKTGNNDGTMTGFSLTGSNSNWVGNPAQQNCTPGGGGTGGNDCVNNALHFDGTNDFVGFGDVNALDFGTSNFTIEFWMKTGNSPAQATPILSKRDGCGCANFWNIVMSPDGKVYFEVSEAGCAKLTTVETSGAVNDGNWHHVAVTRSGATFSIFVDGNTNPTASTGSVANLNNSDPVKLGTSGCVDAGFADYYKGRLDELRVWSVAKSQGQITADKDSELTGAESNLLAYYNFNEGTAGANNAGVNTLPDLAGSANGTLQNFALSGNTSNWVENTTVFANCGSGGGSCPEDIGMGGNVPLASGTYKAQNTIFSTSLIESGSDVTFEAGQSITLSTGFVAESGSTFTARIQACQAVDESEVAVRSEEERPTVGTTSVEVFPNPFQQQTTIQYQLEKSTTVSLEIYDLNGRRIAQPVSNSVQDAGEYQVTFHAVDYPKGIYLVFLRTEEAVVSKRLVLIE